MIPTARRVCYSSFLTASPRIMEPSLLVEVQCSADALDSIYLIIQRRRGHVVSEHAKPGSPLYIVKCNIPALESFGLETDLRYLFKLESILWVKLFALNNLITGHYSPETP